MPDTITVVKLRQTCDACPSQWEGMTDDHRRVYVRYRWGWLSVCLGAPNDMDEWAGVNGAEVFGKQLGDEYDGVLTLDQLRHHTAGVITWTV